MRRGDRWQKLLLIARGPWRTCNIGQRAWWYGYGYGYGYGCGCGRASFCLIIHGHFVIAVARRMFVDELDWTGLDWTGLECSCYRAISFDCRHGFAG